MNLSLTIYNQGTALVREQRVFALDSGENTVDFTDVAETIDRTSVTVKSIPDASAVRVLEQSFHYDLVGLGGLLRRYTDSRIAVTLLEGGEISGVLLNGQADVYAAKTDIILRGEDGQVTVVRDGIRDIRFPQLPDGLRTRPTLRWILESAATGDSTLELTYLADGMRWTADYNLLLAADGQSFGLTGWVTLTNESGTGFHDAQIKLIAGDVQRIQPEQAPREMKLMRMASDGFAGGAAVEQREMFEYQLYEIARRVSLENNETKQVEFLQRTGVPARVVYQIDSHRYFTGYRAVYRDRDPGAFSDPDKIEIYAEFTTAKDGGVGADMPAGRARVFQNDSDGSAVLIGEAHIKHTPEGETLRLLLGRAFDLVSERKQTDYELIRKTELRESFEIRLRNRKDAAVVEIGVIERLFRWSNWSIEASSHPFEKTDVTAIRFNVSVPPQGETVVTYTVRYSFPID